MRRACLRSRPRLRVSAPSAGRPARPTGPETTCDWNSHRPNGRDPEQAVERVGPHFDILAQPSSDQSDQVPASGSRPPAVASDCRIGFRDRDQPRPDQSREIMVVRRPLPDSGEIGPGSRDDSRVAVGASRPGPASPAPMSPKRARVESLARSRGKAHVGSPRRLKMVSIGMLSVSSRMAQARIDSSLLSSRVVTYWSPAAADGVQ